MVGSEAVVLSKIFKWYKKDFPDDILIFLQQYADPSLQQKLQTASDGKYRIRYEDYDWSLNATIDTDSDGEQEIDD